MAHTHRHTAPEAAGRILLAGIVLNTLFVAVEALVGIRIGSMGLVSDAGHNLSDVASLVLAFLAFRLARRPATARYTYGYRKSTILVSLLNSVILLLAVGVIVAESISRLHRSTPVDGGAVIWTAGAGILINGLTAWLLMRERKHDLNMRGAYLHMAADTLVSVGVLASGAVISATGWTFMDPLVALLVAAVILASAWSLLRDSMRLSLDGVPEGIDPEQLRRSMEGIGGVVSVHHLHVWAISTTENALTAHVVTDGTPPALVKSRLRELLAEAGIGHATLETECGEEPCGHPND